MQEKILIILCIVLSVEILYRVFDYALYRLNNIPGDMEEE